MNSLSKQQKKFLKTIENKKTRREQKQQFKLQNKFDSEIVFVDGIFKTDKPEIIAFFEQIPHIVKREENSLTKEKLNELTNPEKTKNYDKVLEKVFSMIDASKVNEIEVVSPIDLSKKVHAQERNQKLFNYISNEFGVSCTDDNLQEIEDIVKDMIEKDNEEIEFLKKKLHFYEKNDSCLINFYRTYTDINK